MLKLIITSLVFTFLSMTTHSHETIIESWSFVKEEAGMKLYTRTIEGFEYKEVKVVTNLQSDLSKARNYLINPENIKHWLSGCTHSEIIKISNSKSEYYATFDAPWPISDRDDVGEIVLQEYSDARVEYAFQSTPKALKKESGYVRVPFSKGKIILTRDSVEEIELTFQFLVDRGGTLPGYIKDYLESSSPLKTAKSLRHVLESLE